MKFAMFYEIPVPRPWTPGKEQAALKNTIEQAVFGEEMGFHSFWTVEHHFLDEFSHCSNPEILYHGRPNTSLLWNGSKRQRVDVVAALAWVL